MHRGYIKLWRKIVDWEWYRDSNALHLLIHLVLKANHKDYKFMGFDVRRGQVVTGRKQLSIDTGISMQSIRTSLSRLKSTNEITSTSTSKFTIITICKYEDYQDGKIEINQQINQQTNQHLTSNQPASNQHLTTIKELKNDNTLKECKEERQADKPPSVGWRTSFDIYIQESEKAFDTLAANPEWMSQRQEFYPYLDIYQTMKKAFIEFWGTMAGWEHYKKKKTKNIDWERTILNAISMKTNQVYKPKTKDGAYAHQR